MELNVVSVNVDTTTLCLLQEDSKVRKHTPVKHLSTAKTRYEDVKVFLFSKKLKRSVIFKTGHHLRRRLSLSANVTFSSVVLLLFFSSSLPL